MRVIKRIMRKQSREKTVKMKNLRTKIIQIIKL